MPLAHNDLTEHQVEQFIQDGFVRIDHGFSRDLADKGRAILWRDTGCDPDDPTTWTRPVIRLGLYGHQPFRDAANSHVLRNAFDALVGRGRWLPRLDLGTFPIRFPGPVPPDNTGWHIDVSFQGADGDPNDFLGWRANVTSKGRALLMLFLFSDVGVDDAPTRIRMGSHFDVARMLVASGEHGLSLRELAANTFAETEGREEVMAIGDAGTVYLCHPFLVHAAQPHRGSLPRFMAQPPLLPSTPFNLNRVDGQYSAVERAIRMALSGTSESLMRSV